MDKNRYLEPQAVPISPCRHSPRLLSNGYYTVDEDSLCWDDLGNLSITPTQYKVSYKENSVRIFRKRRKPHAQRSLDLQSTEQGEDCLSLLEDDVCDCEPYNSRPESADLGNAANTNVSLCPRTFPETAETEVTLKKSGELLSITYSLRTNNDAGIGNTGNDTAGLLHGTPPRRTAESGLCAETSAQHLSSPSSQHTNHENVTSTLHPVRCSPSMTEMENYADEELEHNSTGGYMHVHKGVCTISYDITNWTQADRRKLNKTSSPPVYPAITVKAYTAEQVDAADKTHLVILLLCVLIIFFAWLVFSQPSSSEDLCRRRKVT
ncbi:transmembrane protein 71 isoform X2 [Pseudophryne corroboree]